LDRELEAARKLSMEISGKMTKPLFYLEKKDDVDKSQKLLISSAIIMDCLDIVSKRKDCLGHGIDHVRKVAVDAGALVLIEKMSELKEAELQRMVLLAHTAGILHDIRRLEKNHARAGSEEAGKILINFDFHRHEVKVITDAIANHEAFQPAAELEDPSAQFISDALYDADKFRWGPDNFTEMIWDMVEYRKVSLDILLKRFLNGMEGVRRIRDTFRTDTGRKYGPDFIDRGIEIGTEFYNTIMALKPE
jgi:hypothetical protein